MAKIAVSSQGDTLESQVDPRFGRAAYFVVRDDGGNVSAVDNTAARQMSSGAGIQAAEALAKAGVKKVLSGMVGPKAMNALQAAGIEVIEGAQGRVADALAAYEQGRMAQVATEAVSAAPAGAGMGMGRGQGRAMGPGGGRGRGGGGGGRGGGRGGCRR
ncbi:MAG: NifB/NifX family molybdenum-iron cluster-binding protein [Desulfarculus sp.]|nr:NifB/NifX family molybdenum-iron cluster-binding protein [Pseudomonadota bacterium]MBV1716632.1 NifB/NifX family molybdenum-iron cluster-binding protein [Desulfarculus sp.]MBU4576239.1 NifB/NifX family molybdenum-iron cluster-binding protein [Pseudomonadota bacterium]MBU4597063.1 NifB/NifX family molybdenum-iron cluster-binding protein [Pseudomonadota bacterium]MBV1739308.1 NifB/NifX family molybdenum-iron cluster-binding protein [Desulfarculus sp.]